jgi:MFS family permease
MRWESYHTIWSVILFGWLMIYTTRMVLSPCLVPIMGEFNLSHAEAGFLFTAYFYAYLAMNLPAGYLGDRFGRKKILGAGAIGWTALTFCTGFSVNFLHIFIFRLLTGLGQGTYFSNDRSIISTSTPKNKMGLGQGMTMVGMGVGMALGIVAGGFLAGELGWRATFMIVTLPAIPLCLMIWRWIKDPSKTPSTIGKTVYRQVFKNKVILMIAAASMCIMYTHWFWATWAPTIFLEIGIEKLSTASVYASLIGLSAIPGNLTIGWLSDRAARAGVSRKVVASIVFGLLALSMGAFGLELQTTVPIWLISVTLFLGTFCMWGIYAVLYAILAEVVPERVYGTAFGFVNTIGFTSSIIAPWLTGWIRDVTGSFTYGCYIAVILLVAGSIISLTIPYAHKAKSKIIIENKNTNHK